jgi:hypothetical protein
MDGSRLRSAPLAPKPGDEIEHPGAAMIAAEHPQRDDRHLPALGAAQLQMAIRPIGNGVDISEGRRMHAMNKPRTSGSCNPLDHPSQDHSKS